MIETPTEFFANLPRPPISGYVVPTFFPTLRYAKRITLDIETYDPSLLKNGPGWRRDAHIIGIGVNADDKFKEYYPLRHLFSQNCDPEKVFKYFRSELNNYTGELVGANLNLYDLDGLQLQGIRPLKAKCHDIQWAEPLLDEHSFSYSLDTLARKYLGLTKQESEVEKLYGPDWKKGIREIHPGHLKNYVFGDINLPGAILDLQLKELISQGLLDLFDLESRLCPMLLYMRDKGVRADLKGAERLRDEFAGRIEELQKKADELVGFPVNFHPSKSLFSAFDKLSIKYPYKEPTAKMLEKGKTNGNPSATSEWLDSVDHPFTKLISEVRTYDKIKGTFLEGYILNSNILGRIHPEFHPLKRADDEGSRGTVSGRFSSSNPNLQNIPIEGELGRLIRNLFLPDEGRLWWSKDCSQAEFRLLVHFSVLSGCRGAEIAQRMYIEHPETDFHNMVVELTGLPRKQAKNFNFGLIYGMGKAKIARTLGVSLKEAAELRDVYDKRVPFASEIFKKAMETAQERGYIKTILNRRARFPQFEVNPWTGEQQRSRTHKALNTLLQGSCADFVKTAMLRVWDSGVIGKDFDCYLTEHDELDGSYLPTKLGEESLKEVQYIMENAIKLSVPMKVDSGTGNSWGEAH